jgi:hypothetical protein
MSIYRRLNGLPSTDIAVDQAEVETPVQFQATSRRRASPEDEQQNLRLRKASPANKPLPRTFEWMAGLPSTVRPTALLRDYARIANVIAAAWCDSKALRSYMDRLFNDDRGNRKGFPPDVLDELLSLREYYDSVDTETQPIWADIAKRG